MNDKKPCQIMIEVDGKPDKTYNAYLRPTHLKELYKYFEDLERSRPVPTELLQQLQKISESVKSTNSTLMPPPNPKAARKESDSDDEPTMGKPKTLNPAGVAAPQKGATKETSSQKTGTRQIVESDEEPPSKQPPPQKPAATTNTTTQGRKVVDSDSEDEKTNNRSTTQKSAATATTTTTQARKVVDSEDEDDKPTAPKKNATTTTTTTQPRKVVDSDSEGELTMGRNTQRPAATTTTTTTTTTQARKVEKSDSEEEMTMGGNRQKPPQKPAATTAPVRKVVNSDSEDEPTTGRPTQTSAATTQKPVATTATTRKMVDSASDDDDEPTMGRPTQRPVAPTQKPAATTAATTTQARKPVDSDSEEEVTMPRTTQRPAQTTQKPAATTAATTTQARKPVDSDSEEEKTMVRPTHRPATTTTTTTTQARKPVESDSDGDEKTLRPPSKAPGAGSGSNDTLLIQLDIEDQGPEESFDDVMEGDDFAEASKTKEFKLTEHDKATLLADKVKELTKIGERQGLYFLWTRPGVLAIGGDSDETLKKAQTQIEEMIDDYVSVGVKDFSQFEVRVLRKTSLLTTKKANLVRCKSGSGYKTTLVRQGEKNVIDEIKPKVEAMKVLPGAIVSKSSGPLRNVLLKSQAFGVYEYLRKNHAKEWTEIIGEAKVEIVVVEREKSGQLKHVCAVGGADTDFTKFTQRLTALARDVVFVSMEIKNLKGKEYMEIEDVVEEVGEKATIYLELNKQGTSATLTMAGKLDSLLAFMKSLPEAARQKLWSRGSGFAVLLMKKTAGAKKVLQDGAEEAGATNIKQLVNGVTFEKSGLSPEFLLKNIEKELKKALEKQRIQEYI